jgi:glutamate-5-semialdehyde dehydrogenase
LEVLEKAKRAKEASKIFANLSTETKNKILLKIAEELIYKKNEIISANSLDIKNASSYLSSALIERLTLNEKRIKAMVDGLKEIVNLPDPVGEIVSGWKRPNGLLITKVRVPLGVVGIIYESRPNVTVDVSGLCLKSGNTVVLRGGKEAINSNIILVKIMRDSLKELNLPEDAVSLIEDTSRESAVKMMKLNEYIDVLIPRGGAGLIKTVVENSTIPTIETGVGNCHIYVDESADIEMATNIVFNAKVQRPSVCNAVETLLIHKNIAERFISKIFPKLQEAKVEIRGCEKTKKIYQNILLATEEDWYTEYLDLIIAVKIVEDIDEAISHIQKYSSKHTEAIITNDLTSAKKFTEMIDSAAVFVNASTRFTDGYEFGLGAEIGISTQKLHARGPMGLEALTSTKFVVWGSGQIRE